MGPESTVEDLDDLETLIAAVDALGLPEVGRSTAGRAIGAGRFGAAAGRPVLVVGGVHGDEPASVAAAVELCRALVLAPPAGPVVVMPVMNPDGLAAGTKNSARDVDLNRNFPARNFTTAHEPRYDPGEGPQSEPETQALVALVERLDPVGVVAVHAPFACVNHDGPAERWAEAVAAACGWPVRGDIGYPTPGSLGSWLGRDRALPVLTLELPGGPYAPLRAQAQAALQTAINPVRIR